MSEPEGLGNLPDIGANFLTQGEEDRRQELMDAAVSFARKGFGVVPVRWVMFDGTCSCEEGDRCESPGKHPVHMRWPDVASADPDEVASWWRESPPPGQILTEWWPMANIGLVTGQKFGCFVLDVDTYAGGAQTLAAYERRNGDMPQTRVHSTARGGTHYFFAHPGFAIRNSARKALGPGLDIRGENGFVVAPPSRSGAGSYELNEAHDIPPAPAPDWLLALLRTHDQDQTGASISGAMPTEAGTAGRRYAESALRAESDRMRSAGPGERNDTLNQCAFALGTLGGAGLLTESQAWDALREAAMSAGLGETEIRRTFTSGWSSGLKEPRQVQWNAMAGEWPARPRTEFGLADRMVDHFGSELRWCPDRATWMTYQNGVWVTDTPQAGMWYAQQMIRRLPLTEALAYDDGPEMGPDGKTEIPSPRDQFLEWVAKQQTAKAVASAAKLAVGVPLMRISQAGFDTDPMVLNVRNGVVNLATGDLLKHDPEHRMTLQCTAAWRNEPAPLWEAFLRRVQPDPVVRAYLQRVAGYCATGLTTEQAFFLWTGTGANGKSVAQSVLAHVLGTYSQTMPVSALMASSVDDRIPNDVARMAGKRFLVASESKANRALDEARLKQLTGGDTVSARYMRAEWFEFKPVGKIQLSTNHLPKMSDDAATWRRVHLVPWSVVIPESEQDGNLQKKLIDQESAGILNWIIQGALAWHEEGLNPPEAVHAARTQYQADEDVLRQFITDCLDVVSPVNGADGRSSRELYNAYTEWVKPERPMAIRVFTEQMKAKSPYASANGWRGFPGLRTRPLFSDGGA